MNNAQIAEIFENIAGMLEMKGEQLFTVRAYQRVARTIGGLPVQLEQIVREGGDLKEIPGIGKAISEKIRQLVASGRLEYYEKLRSQFPYGILEVMRVPGVGPKTAKRLWEELQIPTVALLEVAIRDGSVASLPRMGEKKAQNILREIQSAPKDDRIPIARALPAAKGVIAALRGRCPSITRLEAAGSLRRFEETVGDIDLVCAAENPIEVLDALVGLPNVTQVIGHGDTKASVLLNEGVQVDLRVVESAQYGALMQYFTGSQQHNIRLREYAVKQGLSLNEYGITTTETGELEQFCDEAGFYRRLGLQYVPPELRRGMGEIEVAARGDIPRLVETADIKGDLHLHTDWSDGRDTTEDMVAAAKEQGYDYIAVTDHSVGRGIANGLTEERLAEHMAELREVESRLGGIRLLGGSEVDIRADGTLDYTAEVLAGLDWVVASVHSAMGQDSATMTERVIKAMRHPEVSVIGHLTTRRIGQRKPIEADFEAIFKAAADTGTALEINGSPERLDLKDSHAHMARELGAMLVISSDAHSVGMLDNQPCGVAVARRAWCESRHILNTMTAAEFGSFLGLAKADRPLFFASRG